MAEQAINGLSVNDGRPQLSKMGEVQLASARKSSFKNFPAFQSIHEPQGVVNFGVAESSLCHPELVEIFNSYKLSEHNMTYGDSMHGSKHLQRALCTLFNDKFAPLQPVESEHLIIGNGLIDQMATLIANPGDCFLIARPYYNGFDMDVSARANCSMVGVELSNLSDPAVLRKAFDTKIAELKSSGPTPRAIIITNPGNPIATIMSDDILLEYCRIAERHNVHLISDEIYALGVFSSSDFPTKPKFRSMLSFDLRKEGIDPSRIHVVYGMSKDWCSNGLRLACAISQHNADLMEAWSKCCILMKPSSAAEILWSGLLTDVEKRDWYLNLNAGKLTKAYERAIAFLREWQIPYEPACSGHFLWCDLRQYVAKDGKTATAEDEQELFQAFFAAGLYIAPGANYKSLQPGFFRLTFTLLDWQADIGYPRLASVLQKRRARSSSSA